MPADTLQLGSKQQGIATEILRTILCEESQRFRQPLKFLLRIPAFRMAGMGAACSQRDAVEKVQQNRPDRSTERVYYLAGVSSVFVGLLVFFEQDTEMKLDHVKEGHEERVVAVSPDIGILVKVLGGKLERGRGQALEGPRPIQNDLLSVHEAVHLELLGAFVDLLGLLG